MSGQPLPGPWLAIPVLPWTGDPPALTLSDPPPARWVVTTADGTVIALLRGDVADAEGTAANAKLLAAAPELLAAAEAMKALVAITGNGRELLDQLFAAVAVARGERP